MIKVTKISLEGRLNNSIPFFSLLNEYTAYKDNISILDESLDNDAHKFILVHPKWVTSPHSHLSFFTMT